VCGDSLDPAVVSALMDGEQAEMVFTDPPYNVAIEGNVSGLGKIRHREFAMASGEMTRGQFTAFLSSAFANLVAHSLDGSIHFVCMDWRHMSEMLEAGQAIGPEKTGCFCCIELSQLFMRRQTSANGSLRASRFESPQLHQVVGVNRLL
jgi:hypothetical protein